MKKLNYIFLTLFLLTSLMFVGCGEISQCSIIIGCYSYNLTIESTEPISIKSHGFLYEMKNSYTDDHSIYVFQSGPVNDAYSTSKSLKFYSRQSQIKPIPLNPGKIEAIIGLYIIPKSTGVEMDFSVSEDVYVKIENGVIKLFQNQNCTKEKVFTESYSGIIEKKQLDITVRIRLTIDVGTPILS